MKACAVAFGLAGVLASMPLMSLQAQVRGGHTVAFEGCAHHCEEAVGGTFYMSNKGSFASARYGHIWKSDSGFPEASSSLAVGWVDFASVGTGIIDGTFIRTIIFDMRGSGGFHIGGRTLHDVLGGIGIPESL